MTQSVEDLLDEAQRLYAAGDAHGALACWAHVLDVAPGHHVAVQYTAFVRRVLHLDDPAPAPHAPTTERSHSIPAPSTSPPPREPSRSMPAPSTSPPPREPSRSMPATHSPLLGISWAAVVDGDDDGLVDGAAHDGQAAASPAPVAPVSVPVEHKAPAQPPPRDSPASNDEDVVVLTSAEPDPVGDGDPEPSSVAAAGPPPSATAPTEPVAAVAGRVEERVVRQSVRFDEPMPMAGFLRAASLPPTAVPVAPTSSGVPRAVTEALFPAGRPEERVVRQSIRFDEPPTAETLPTKPRKTPTAAPPAAAIAADHQPSAPTLAEVPASPWDDHGGPAAMVDLDATPRATSGFAASPRAAVPLQAPAFDQARIDTPPVPTATTAPAAPVDVNDALMNAARELFDLGDFSGSLERVEQVLRTDPQHEGARAYVQRNEATLTKMYESKLGDLTRAPRQLIRPDEVVWVTMHHRAGFVLSQVDGSLTFNDLIDVAGIKRFDAVRILADLVGRGIVG